MALTLSSLYITVKKQRVASQNLPQAALRSAHRSTWQCRSRFGVQNSTLTQFRRRWMLQNANNESRGLRYRSKCENVLINIHLPLGQRAIAFYYVSCLRIIRLYCRRAHALPGSRFPLEGFPRIAMHKSDDEAIIKILHIDDGGEGKAHTARRNASRAINCLWYAKLVQSDHDDDNDDFGKRVLLLYVTHWPNFYQPCGINQVFLDGCNRCRWLDSLFLSHVEPAAERRKGELLECVLSLCLCWCSWVTYSSDFYAFVTSFSSHSSTLTFSRAHQADQKPKSELFSFVRLTNE